MPLNVTRRRFVGGSLGGLFSLALKHNCQQLIAAESAPRTKRCVILWMGGGPSQLDTFDPRPGTSTGGPTTAIRTAVPGIEIASTLPEINGQNGRDHFPQVTPVVLGGGGIKGGTVVGRADAAGHEIIDGAMTVPDLFATLLSALGIDPEFPFRTEFGAVAPASDHGRPVSALLST